MAKKKDKDNMVSYDRDFSLNGDRAAEKTMAICGLAIGISCLVFAAIPVAVWLYIMAILERTKAYINQSVFILVVCGVSVVGSLAASIVAKIKDKRSRWAVFNIVFISINLVISALVSWFFIWVVNTYGH